MTTRPSSLVLLAVSALSCGLTSIAADKSGVSPNTISLPKGPGSIEGLGESFQPTLNTGTAKYGIALKVPPGTAGQAPALTLRDRKSTRLNSSHLGISYAVFCLKKKKR